MIKFLIIALFSSGVFASAPFLRLSVDKETYHPLEQSVLSVELVTSPENEEYEFFVGGSFNGEPCDLIRLSDFVWGQISAPIENAGNYSWHVDLYFIKKSLYSPIVAVLNIKEYQVLTTTDPTQRTKLLNEIQELKLAIQGMKRKVKEYSLEITVLESN